MVNIILMKIGHKNGTRNTPMIFFFFLLLQTIGLAIGLISWTIALQQRFCCNLNSKNGFGFQKGRNCMVYRISFGWPWSDENSPGGSALLWCCDCVVVVHVSSLGGGRHSSPESSQAHTSGQSLCKAVLIASILRLPHCVRVQRCQTLSRELISDSYDSEHNGNLVF